MYFYTWYQWLLFFFIYCFIGWMIESTFVSIKCGHFVNRGFLRLPLLPLYGSGSILMLWLSIPVQNNLLLVFLFGMVGASVLEYITGYAMERLFKMKYWDYTKDAFNLNGYICLGTSIAWGFLTIVLTEFVHRPIEYAVLNLSPLLCIAISLFVSFFFVADAIRSIKEALDLGRVLESMTKLKAEVEEVQLQLALLRAEAVQKAAGLREETVVKLAELKTTTVGYRENVRKSVSDLTSLSERLQSLTERRERVSHQLNFYRKGILRGNPTASSRQFSDALRELKEYSSSRKKKDPK